MMNQTYTAVLADDELYCVIISISSWLSCGQRLRSWPVRKMVKSLCRQLNSINLMWFLDIRMPKMDGIEVARRLLQQPKVPLVVFITAYDEYAVSAFETHAIDYLLKPLSSSRLASCCEKLQQQLRRNVAPSNDLAQLMSQFEQLTRTVKPQYQVWLKASKGEEIHLIAVNELLYVKAEDKYLSLYKVHGATTHEYLLRSSLKELLAQLDPNQFWQIHRSIVVNVGKIDKVTRDFGGKMWVHIDRLQLPVSRALQHLFKVS